MFGLGVNKLGATNQKPFSPASLFSNAEAGVWYDPADAAGGLTWRRNLHEYSESFSLWTETNVVITEDVIAGPYENTLADKFVANSSAGTAWILQDQPIVRGQTYTQTIFAKAGEVSWLQITPSTAFNNGHQNYNLATGELGTNTSGVGNVASIENVGNGWYRCSLSTTATATTSAGRFAIGWMGGDDGRLDSNGTVIPDGVKGVYIWGAQLEQSSTATEYQPIRTTFEAAFKFANPKHTLYQDSNGQTPVTAVGEPVGLMLDKSRGLQLGDELVDTANTASAWTPYSSNTVIQDGSAIKISYVDHVSGAYIYFTESQGTSETLTVGKTYEVTLKAKVNSGSEVLVEIQNGSVSSLIPVTSTDYVDIKYTITVVNNSFVRTVGMTVGEIVWVKDISVKEVKGSHATQPTSTKRPIYARHPEGGIRNLFNYTEQFDNGYWTKFAGATASGTTINLPATDDRVFRNYTPLSNTAYTYSAILSGSGTVTLQVQMGGVNSETQVTLTATPTKHSFTVTTTSTAAGYVFIRKRGSDTATTLTCDGVQLEEATEASNYQKVVTDIDVTESGVGEVYYLKFDGADDGMQINNLTSSSTPLTALFGVELNANNKWLLDIQSGRTVFGGNQYDHSIFDGSWINGEPEVLNTPIVLTYDAVQSDLKIRTNGIVETTSSAYNENAIGGSISLFQSYTQSGSYVNGNMYQVVLRAAESTDKEIDQAEEFVAIKTGLKSEVVGLATLDLNFGANTYTAKNSNGGVI